MARILVAEPDPDALALMERAIAASGHEAVLYRPGSELPSVDVMLFEPGMGQRVIALAKVLASASPPVPIVVVSIRPPEPSVHELRPVAYVLKPFSLDELRAAVEKAVRISGERA
jgi:DNA-binding response OmpR family regulator